MIAFWDLRRALQKEWNHLARHELRTQFIEGMIQGLKLADLLATKLRDAAKDRQSPNPSGYKNSYLKAIITAHRQLKSYNRSHALQTLEKVINRANPQ